MHKKAIASSSGYLADWTCCNLLQISLRDGSCNELKHRDGLEKFAILGSDHAFGALGLRFAMDGVFLDPLPLLPVLPVLGPRGVLCKAVAWLYWLCIAI